MIHDTEGRTGAVPYGKKDQCILSIDRRFLNELLLNGNFLNTCLIQYFFKIEFKQFNLKFFIIKITYCKNV
jgi:hypothetical protein